MIVDVCFKECFLRRVNKAPSTAPNPIFRCNPFWWCYRLVSRAKVIENQPYHRASIDGSRSGVGGRRTLGGYYGLSGRWRRHDDKESSDDDIDG
ncbi:hypothetical protein Tco_0153059 [Tanacetum coccineum]